MHTKLIMVVTFGLIVGSQPVSFPELGRGELAPHLKWGAPTSIKPVRIGSSNNKSGLYFGNGGVASSRGPSARHPGGPQKPATTSLTVSHFPFKIPLAMPAPACLPMEIHSDNLSQTV